MHGFSVGTLFRRSMRILIFVVAWALIYVALLATLLPLFSTWTRLALVLFPAILIAFLLIKWSLCWQQKAKTSTSAFYITMIACLLFLSASVALFIMGGSGSLDKTVQNVFQLKRIPPIGLMAQPKLQHRLFLNGVKLDILRALPHTGRAEILGYKVHGYLYSNIQFLFSEIFIDQSYFF